jgi:hypothetical protein
MELYDEFIGYLWNDKNTLSACSLASRILTVASQKRLFCQIILDAKAFDVGGTSSAFHRLLERSPHIAEYVQCLQIIDMEAPDGSDSDYSDDWLDALNWLPNDTFLPLFLPLLGNLKAFVLCYVPDWDLLCDEIRRCLQDLIRLPSLVYVDLSPRPMLTECFGKNIKHLVVREEDPSPMTHTSPGPSGCPPIYLETLFMTQAGTILTRLTSDPNCQFKTSQLRKLGLHIQTDRTFQHFALCPLLYSCRETLEEFTFIPYIDCESNSIFHGTTLTLPPASSETDVSAPQYTPVDLSQMISLKNLILYFEISCPALSDWDPLWCFSNLLRSAHKRLEDITVVVELDGRIFTDAFSFRYLNEALDALRTPSRFPRLRKLAIHAMDSDYGGAPAFIALLDASESMEQLRARLGIEVITMVEEGKPVQSIVRYLLN